MVVPAEKHGDTATKDIETRLLLLRHQKTPLAEAPATVLRRRLIRKSSTEVVKSHNRKERERKRYG